MVGVLDASDTHRLHQMSFDAKYVTDVSGNARRAQGVLAIFVRDCISRYCDAQLMSGVHFPSAILRQRNCHEHKGQVH